MDSRILAVVSRDIVAAEAHYHRSCYRLYTKDEAPQQKGAGSDGDGDEDEDQYDAALCQSYRELFHYLRMELFDTPRVLMMTDVTSRLVTSLMSFGIDQVKDSTKKHLRRRLENEFGGSVHIIPDQNGRLLLYSDSLTVEDLVRENQSLQRELQTLSRGGGQELLTKAANQIRGDIKTKAKDASQAWPPEVESYKCDLVPKSLLSFLRTLLTGCDDPDGVTSRVQRLLESFGHDIVYAVTCGKTKPPKHIVLPFSVKSLTGNVELISILNRLGHSVSYSQMEEIDTALCLQKLSASGGEPPLPSNIFRGVFTTLAWDNIDRLEETLSGEGTSHRVNGIAVQAKPTDPVPAQPMPLVDRTKKRSIDAPQLMLPTYNAGQRPGPPMSETAEVDTAAETQLARQKNLVWMLARMLRQEDQPVSSWTGFNIMTRDEVAVSPDNVGYLPTINAPATQMSTVNEVLKQSLSIKQSLGLTNIVCVFDQALYAKAVEITWKHPEQFGSIIIRMGAFHTICTHLATIGKRFQDAGLHDLCVESGVIAEGSITGIMEGRKYNRAVRLHKLMYEALMRLAWKGFLPWLEAKHIDNTVHLEEALRAIDSFSKEISQAGLEQIFRNPSCTRILELIDEYLDVPRCGSGLAAFWVTYLDMVDILLGLIRASREGDWKLHLACIRAMIPWCFAYDRINYARYLPYYFAQMIHLPTTHPEVHEELMAGRFSVQLGSVNPFGCIPVDQTIEETVNKDTQTAGGTKGFSLKPGAVTKYYITQEYKSRYLRQLRQMTGGCNSKLAHPDLQTDRMKKDEQDVQALTDLMENSWLNPMSPDEDDIISLSTGTVAPPEVSSDLLRARAVGEAAYQEFKARLEEDPGKFHSKLKKQSLKTFANISVKSQSKKTQNIVLKADRNLFSHMILVAESRQVNMKDVLAHPLGPLPWALANPDGTLRKTNKAVLARELEKNVSPAEEIPSPSATIIDGMGLVQKLNGSNKTFGQVAELAFAHVLHEGAQSRRIHVVFDVYRSTSIKDAERVSRGADSSLQYKNIAGGHHVQQWRKFLCGSSNKTSLMKFLSEEWKLSKYKEKLQEKELYITCEQTCFKVTEDDWEEVPELESTQEEADTRLLLHTLHAAKDGYKAAIICSEDTDVFIISLAKHSAMDISIYQKFGTKNRTRYADVTKIGSSQGPSVCDSLIGLHAFTGCDSVSCFAGRGKLSALKLLKKDPSNQAFQQLGQCWELSDDLFEKLELFTCTMYAGSSNKSSRGSSGHGVNSVNELRYQLFCAKRGEAESSLLPPCRDCLLLHAQRANFQAAIWRRCLEAKPDVPSPTEHGWTEEDGKLAILWMRSAPAPEVVLELLACKCARVCKLPSCTCLVNGLACTDMCNLQNCTNQAVQQQDDPEPDLEPDSEDE